jgi:hypothetical protein
MRWFDNSQTKTRPGIVYKAFIGLLSFGVVLGLVYLIFDAILQTAAINTAPPPPIYLATPSQVKDHEVRIRVLEAWIIMQETRK